MLQRGRCFPSIDTTEVDPGRANTISANSVPNTYDATNADGRLADLLGYNYAELDDCRKRGGCGTRHLAAIRNYY